MDFPIHPIVHIVVDVQPNYLRQLNPSRQKSFPIAVRKFADRLRPYGIPTVWVVLLNEFQMYGREIAWSIKDAPIRCAAKLEKFTLEQVAVRQDEDGNILASSSLQKQLVQKFL